MSSTKKDGRPARAASALTAGPFRPLLATSGRSRPKLAEIAQPRRRLRRRDIGQHHDVESRRQRVAGTSRAPSTMLQRIEIAAKLVEQGGDLDVENRRAVVQALDVAVQAIARQIEE